LSRRASAALAFALLGLACARHDGSAPSPPPPNVASGRAVSLSGGRGEPAAVTDGRLAPEGAAPDSTAAVLLEDVRSSLDVDLGRVQPVGALLLQARADSTYFLETSVDGSVWQIVWRSLPVAGASGLRTRTAVLPRVGPARWLRVRPTKEAPAAVSELQAFAAEPETWPALDLSLPYSRLPLWPALTRERAAVLFTAIGALLMLVVAWSALARRFPEGIAEARTRRAVLAAVGALSLLAWPNFLNFNYFGFVHRWDVFHYYMGGKYLRELGYTRLYACAAAADAEDGIDLRGRVMRDLRDNRMVPAEAVLELSPECRTRFSPRRWEEFRHDARFFRDLIGADGWAATRSDHGFNATPAWAVIGGPIANLAPASLTQVTLIALLDVLLVLAIVAVIGICFGLEAGGIAAGYWGVNALAAFGWTGGGFLRYDWVFWLVVGVAALRREHPTLAGFALGYSTLLRVFPACAILGVALKVLVEAAAERSVRPLARQARFALGAAAATVLFVGASSLMVGRAQIWREFADNSAKHLETASANLVGLEPLAGYQAGVRLETLTDPLLVDEHAVWRTRLSAAERASWPARAALAGAFLLLLVVALRGVPAWGAAVLGLGVMPVLLKLSSYYYVALVAYAALWPLSAGVGLALVGFAWATNVILALGLSPDGAYAWLSLALLALVTGVTAAFAWRGRGPVRPNR
jgi:hypothetical protein